MNDHRTEEPGDRIIVTLEPGGPIELDDLASSFAALARFYERHHRAGGAQGAAPRLFVSRLETGSVVAEIAPYVAVFGAAVYAMDASLIVSDFVRRLGNGIKAFANPGPPPKGDAPTRADAADIAAFIKPIAGRKGAALGLRRARMEKRDGEKATVVEYRFDEAEINRASINANRALEQPDVPVILPPPDPDPPRTMALSPVLGPPATVRSEAMLFFEPAGGKPGKRRGRAAMRGVIPDVSEQALPVYFRKSCQELKDRMARGEVDPLANAFVVDVEAQFLGGEPRGYVVTAVHEVLPLEDDEAED